jgi:hypothetical protein
VGEVNERLAVATWNVERVSMCSWKRFPAIQAAISAVDADIWVLTETRMGLCPAEGYHALHTPGRDHRYEGADERMASIWSRWPITPTGIPPRARGFVSGLVDAPFGQLAVVGSVIPYASDRGPDGVSKNWVEHRLEIDWLAEELPQLARMAPVVMAGDLNQDRDGSGFYGTRTVRAALTDALDGADMVCLTEEDVVAAGKLQYQHLIDHVCVSTTLVERGWTVDCWEPIDADGVRMSDHPGVVVRL